MKPEMSARELTDELVKRIRSKQYSFVLANYANPDMVGHTGILEAAVKAVEVIDECLGRIVKAAQEAGAVVMITADHGNLEAMTDHTTGQPHTAHTTDPVPFILVGDKAGPRDDGCLADVAPTVLQFMAIQQPPEMTGKSLVA
jgi:2,3-bisphosphoglycerate-independent phosphoglycerate mutase